MPRAHKHKPGADGRCRGCGIDVVVVTYDDLVLAWGGHTITCSNCRGKAAEIFKRCGGRQQTP